MMTGSQKFAVVLGVIGFILLAVALFIYIKGPEVDARNRQREEKRIRDLSQVVATLDQEAARRGLYYHIYCTAYYKGDPETWRATATPGKPMNIYYEDGAVSYWDSGMETFDSKEEAAEALLAALSKEPNTTPQHRRDNDRADCPPVSGGGPKEK